MVRLGLYVGFLGPWTKQGLIAPTSDSPCNEQLITSFSNLKDTVKETVPMYVPDL